MTGVKFNVWADYTDESGIRRRALVAVRDRVHWTWRHANRIARAFTFAHGAVTLVKEA